MVPQQINQTDKPQIVRTNLRSELATLLGMTVSICSLYLVWQTRTPPAMALAQISGALYSNPTVSVTGFQTSVHWPLTVFALCSGITLLAPPGDRWRMQVGFVQAVSAMMVLLISLVWWVRADFAPLSGIVTSICGSLAIVYGAYDRYVATTPDKN